MGFNIYVDSDKRRKIEWWCITEDHELYCKWGKRLAEACRGISDQFIASKPFLLYTVDEQVEVLRPGMIKEGIFFENINQIDFGAECFLLNTEFWKQCGSEVSFYDMILKMGDLIEDTEKSLEILRDWSLRYGLHCFSVHPLG